MPGTLFEAPRPARRIRIRPGIRVDILNLRIGQRRAAQLCHSLEQLFFHAEFIYNHALHGKWIIPVRGKQENVPEITSQFFEDIIVI